MDLGRPICDVASVAWMPMVSEASSRLASVALLLLSVGCDGGGRSPSPRAPVRLTAECFVLEESSISVASDLPWSWQLPRMLQLSAEPATRPGRKTVGMQVHGGDVPPTSFWRPLGESVQVMLSADGLTGFDMTLSREGDDLAGTISAFQDSEPHLLGTGRVRLRRVSCDAL